MADYAASVQAVGVRVTKLDGSGAPITGATSSYVTRAFTRASWTPEYEEGEEIKTIGADGTICIQFKMPDVLKEVAFELEICNPQPELHEMLAGGTLLTEGGENIGWASPDVGDTPNMNGVSVEVWSRAVVGNRIATVNPFWRWVFPFVQTRMEGDRALENGAMASVFSGKGYGNAGWDGGPSGDWTWPTPPVAYARTASAPTTEGYFEVAA